MTKIKRLNWESDFFKFEVGELNMTENQLNTSNIFSSNVFELIVTKQINDIPIHFKSHFNNYSETKRIYSKTLDSIQNNLKDIEIFDYDVNTCELIDLLELAYTSGNFSRFKCDTKFTIEQFQFFYKTWVINSLNKQIADKIFYIKNKATVIGFISLKENIHTAQIGLFAISPNYQGQGLGRKLLLAAENYCKTNNIGVLNIPTQKKNTQACAFYEKNKYSILEDLIIKHYWKN